MRPRAPEFLLGFGHVGRPPEFAANLLSLDQTNIIHIQDSTKQQVDLVPAKDLPKLLEQEPRADCISRFVLILDDQADTARVDEFMCQQDSLGRIVNAIYFSQSKYQSKRLAMRLDAVQNGRTTSIYDADLPPEERRAIEKRLNDRTTRGLTVLGTNALELGLDIEGLDICMIDETPPRRANLLQRIGRVGRRVGSPGLVVLRLSPKPHDRDMLTDLVNAFQLDQTRLLPIPLHVESLRWQSILVAYTDWATELRSGKVPLNSFNEAIRIHFNLDPVPSWVELEKRYLDRYGQLVNTADKFWVYKKFRATGDGDKIPLMSSGEEIARIDNMAIFRDAHPGAVYLGHDRKSYRVVEYEGKFKIAEWRHPDSDTVLGKWLKTVRSIRVELSPKRITTRGTWADSYGLVEIAYGAEHLHGPKQGACKVGVWDFARRWTGYTEFDLSNGRSRRVNSQEATKIFGEAMDAGKSYPFLHPLSYRTSGWQWDFGRVDFGNGDPKAAATLSIVIGGLLEHFLAAAVESTPDDLRIELSARAHQLLVLDSAPGGNGLSGALLMDNRMAQALEKLGVTLKKHVGKSADRTKGFKKYLIALHVEHLEHSAQELLDVIRKLQLRWTG
jgi:hypothetical protein